MLSSSSSLKSDIPSGTVSPSVTTSVASVSTSASSFAVWAYPVGASASATSTAAVLARLRASRSASSACPGAGLSSSSQSAIWVGCVCVSYDLSGAPSLSASSCSESSTTMGSPAHVPLSGASRRVNTKGGPSSSFALKFSNRNGTLSARGSGTAAGSSLMLAFRLARATRLKCWASISATDVGMSSSSSPIALSQSDSDCS